jgi:hypothetical protein
MFMVLAGKPMAFPYVPSICYDKLAPLEVMVRSGNHSPLLRSIHVRSSDPFHVWKSNQGISKVWYDEL